MALHKYWLGQNGTLDFTLRLMVDPGQVHLIGLIIETNAGNACKDHLVVLLSVP